MVSIKDADEQQLAEMKAWFFKENIRLQEARQELEEERRQFEIEKQETLSEMQHQRMIEEISKKQLKRDQDLFEKKLAILQNELRRLAEDKQQLEREKALFKERIANQQKQAEVINASTRLFFRGVNSETALKKRYRELIKIFHPDNMDGDTVSIQNINREYDILKGIYSVS